MFLLKNEVLSKRIQSSALETSVEAPHRTYKQPKRLSGGPQGPQSLGNSLPEISRRNRCKTPGTSHGKRMLKWGMPQVMISFMDVIQWEEDGKGWSNDKTLEFGGPYLLTKPHDMTCPYWTTNLCCLDSLDLNKHLLKVTPAQLISTYTGCAHPWEPKKWPSSCTTTCWFQAPWNHTTIV